MRGIIGLVAAVLLVGAVTVATAQSIESGTVVRVDPQSRVVLLDDGRMYRVTPSTLLLVENQSVPFTALVPGQRIVIQSGEPVVVRGGQYVAVTTAPPAVTTAPPVVAQAPPVVTQTPVPTAAVPVGVRQVVHGTISEVDSDGEVRIKTERDSFKVKLSREALRTVKKGDAVTVDLTITPLGSPSASPR